MFLVVNQTWKTYSFLLIPSSLKQCTETDSTTYSYCPYKQKLCVKRLIYQTRDQNSSLISHGLWFFSLTHLRRCLLRLSYFTNLLYTDQTLHTFVLSKLDCYLQRLHLCSLFIIFNSIQRLKGAVICFGSNGSGLY